MGRSLISVYALAVCFCTLMCLIIAMGFGSYDLIRIAAPEFTMSDQTWQNTDQQFLKYYPDKKDLPAADLKAFRAENKLLATQAERHAALQSFVWVAIIGVIDSVVYALHWRLAKSEQARVESAPRAAAG